MAQILTIDDMDAMLRAPAPAPGPAPAAGLSIDDMDRLLNVSRETGLNKPTGEMRAYTGAPLRQGRDVIDHPDFAAPGSALARASLAPDQNDQIKRLAASMFPNEPLERAVKRFGIIDGEIVYGTPDGRIAKVAATMGEGSIRDPVDLIRRTGQQMASQAGPTIPALAATATGVAMGPTGMSIPAAGGAATIADAGRQMLDRGLAGEDLFRENKTLGVDIPNIDYANAAGQGALNAGGQAMGVGMTRAMTSNPLGVAAAERLKATDPAKLAEWQRLRAEARQRGVTLTVGDLTDLGSIKGRERTLRDYDETKDLFENVLKRRNTAEVPAAIGDELDRIAPAPTGGTAAGAVRLREGADAVMKGAQAERSRAASPYYQRAFASGAQPDTTAAFQEIGDLLQRRGASTPSGKALAGMYKALTEEVPNPAGGDPIRVPIRDYEKLHSIKEAFDDIVSSALQGETSATRRAARDLTNVKALLTDALKSAHPAYDQGATIFRTKSIPINAMDKGAIGVMLNKDGPQSIRFAEAIFDAANDIPPAEITKTRHLYQAAGKIDDWNAGVRSFLADRLDEAMKTDRMGRSNVAGAFEQKIWGNPKQRAIMKAAIQDPVRMQGIERLMEVLQAAARSMPEGSPTAGKLEAMRMMNEPGMVAKAVGKVTSPGTLLTAGNDIVKGITDMRRPGQRLKFAEALLDPDALETLGHLRMLSPTSEKALAATWQLLSGAIGAAGTERLTRADDREPSVYASEPN